MTENPNFGNISSYVSLRTSFWRHNVPSNTVSTQKFKHLRLQVSTRGINVELKRYVSRSCFGNSEITFVNSLLKKHSDPFAKGVGESIIFNVQFLEER